MTIEELSEQTGVPVRTIRYYITENLLPHSKSRGRGADYTEEHVLRLRLVSELSRKNVPIARQREMLAQMTLDQVRAELAEVEPPSPLTGAAYIQSLLDAASHGRRRQSPATTSTPPPSAVKEHHAPPEPGPKVQPTPVTATAPFSSPSPTSTESDAGAEGAINWKHYQLVRGVELVVRLDAEIHHAGLVQEILETGHRYRHRRRSPSS